MTPAECGSDKVNGQHLTDKTCADNNKICCLPQEAKASKPKESGLEDAAAKKETATSGAECSGDLSSLTLEALKNCQSQLSGDKLAQAQKLIADKTKALTPKASAANLAWAGALHGALAGGVVGGALLWAEYTKCTLPAWLKTCTDAKTEALIDADAGESDLMITSCLGPNWKVGLSEAPATQAEEQPPEATTTT